MYICNRTEQCHALSWSSNGILQVHILFLHIGYYFSINWCSSIWPNWIGNEGTYGQATGRCFWSHDAINGRTKQKKSAGIKLLDISPTTFSTVSSTDWLFNRNKRRSKTILPHFSVTVTIQMRISTQLNKLLSTMTINWNSSRHDRDSSLAQLKLVTSSLFL